jgi:hypothetical protein
MERYNAQQAAGEEKAMIVQYSVKVEHHWQGR